MFKFKQNSSWVTILVGVAAFVFYLLFLPQQISGANWGWDGGDLAAAAATGGIAHPTGYPAYLLLAKLSLLIPLGTTYWKIGLISSLSAAVAVGLCVWLAVHYGWSGANSWSAALIGGLALAVSPLWFSQAVIVEVNSLGALIILVGLIWGLVLRSRHSKQAYRKRDWILPLICGFGLGVHLSLAFLLPWLAFCGIKARKKNGVNWHFFVKQGFAFWLGALVYLYLPFAAISKPQVIWGAPDTPAGFWWLVSGELYRGLLFSGSSQQVVEKLGTISGIFWNAFSPLGFVLAVVGGITLRKSVLFWPSIYLILVFTIFSLVYGSVDSLVYLLIPLAMMAVWLSAGLRSGLTWISNPRLRLAGIILLSIIILANAVPRVQALIPNRDVETSRFIRAFELLPENAILVSEADQDTFPLWYDRYAAGNRADISLITFPLLQFTWYVDHLRDLSPRIIIPGEAIDKKTLMKNLTILNSGRVVCESRVETNHRKIVCGSDILYEGKFIDPPW